MTELGEGSRVYMYGENLQATLNHSCGNGKKMSLFFSRKEIARNPPPSGKVALNPVIIETIIDEYIKLIAITLNIVHLIVISCLI